MGFITDLFESTVVYKGHRFRTDASYDTILAVQMMYKDENLTDYEKVVQALRMLIRCSVRAALLSPDDKIGLLEAVFSQQIKVESKPSGHKKERLVDFELDGEYIYASFYQDYGIDLIEQQGRLHWKKFLALFQGLSDDTKIKQVMHIRGMDPPKPTKNNQEQIQKFWELKSYYALPVKGGGGQDGLNSLFDTLERYAV